jgi:chromosome segregation ATPase
MAAAGEEETDSLTNLEERITRAVELVNRLREERAALEQRLAAVESERDEARREANLSAVQAQKFGHEIDELRSERKQVRTRIEKLLGQMDLLSAT